jgi:hypothetical protein
VTPEVNIRSNLKRHRFLFLVAGCALLITGLAFLSPVSYAGSDSLLNLVVSQAILEQGTIRIDAYTAEIIAQTARTPYEIAEYRGHSYQMYPLGTPVFSLPFVWIANLFGRDMAIIDHNYRLQNDLSALSCALIFLVLYWSGRIYVTRKASLLISLISVLGSALISTVGTALWSTNLTALFIALSLLILARYHTGQAQKRDPYLLGFTLFAAFFCRPAAATFIVVALAYLWITQRKEGGKVALTALGFLLLLVGFSWIEFGQLLPRYYFGTPLGWLTGRQMGGRLLDALVTILAFGMVYLWFTRHKLKIKLVVTAIALLLAVIGLVWLQSVGRLADFRLSLEWLKSGRIGLGTGLYGMLLSPSRGLLVFSPFFVPVLLGSLVLWKKTRRAHLASVALLSFGLHLLGLVSTGAWWGGYAFGPRLLTDLLPALVLLTCILWKVVSSHATPLLPRIGAASYMVLGLVAILINSYQGLWNVNTLRWNGEMAPAIEEHPGYVFECKYPQFLATSQSICDRNLEHMTGQLELGSINPIPYHLGDQITYRSGFDGTKPVASDQDTLPPTEPQPVAAGIPEVEIPPRDQQVFVPWIAHTVRNGVFAGWLRSEEGYRWSACRSSRIFFELGGFRVTDQELLLDITAGSLGVQKVTVRLNGVRIGDVNYPGPEAPPVTRTLRFDGSLLRENAPNEIEIYMPNASSPDKGDDRTLGLTFAALRLYTAE